jgi:hypothetical protein
MLGMVNATDGLGNISFYHMVVLNAKEILHFALGKHEIYGHRRLN